MLPGDFFCFLGLGFDGRDDHRSIPDEKRVLRFAQDDKLDKGYALLNYFGRGMTLTVHNQPSQNVRIAVAPGHSSNDLLVVNITGKTRHAVSWRTGDPLEGNANCGAYRITCNLRDLVTLPS